MVSDSVIIVAGGGNGLGRAVAVELGKLGATVVVNDLGTEVNGEITDGDPAAKTVKQIREADGTAMAHGGDISSLEYTESLVEDTVKEYGCIDGVVNFAGVLRDAISYKMTGEQWDTVIDVHLRGHFSLLRNVAAHWRERAREEDFEGGRSFLCVSSDSAFGNPGQANYGAAKAGVLGLTRTTARELARFGVRVNVLMPRGYSRMTEQIPEEHRPYTREEMPPEKIAPLVAYLLGEESSDVTGCTFLAGGDAIAYVSDPSIERVAFEEGGWTVDRIAEEFPRTLGRGQDMSRTFDALW